MKPPMAFGEWLGMAGIKNIHWMVAKPPIPNYGIFVYQKW
jgi:hypothetical protein